MSTLYFTREEMDAAWRAIRPLNCDDDLDTVVLASPVLAMLIRCRALAFRRARHSGRAPDPVAHTFRLGKPRSRRQPAPQPRKARAAVASQPDAKQRAANDLDLFTETLP